MRYNNSILLIIGILLIWIVPLITMTMILYLTTYPVFNESFSIIIIYIRIIWGFIIAILLWLLVSYKLKVIRKLWAFNHTDNPHILYYQTHNLWLLRLRFNTEQTWWYQLVNTSTKQQRDNIVYNIFNNIDIKVPFTERKISYSRIKNSYIIRLWLGALILWIYMILHTYSNDPLILSDHDEIKWIWLYLMISIIWAIWCIIWIKKIINNKIILHLDHNWLYMKSGKLLKRDTLENIILNGEKQFSIKRRLYDHILYYFTYSYNWKTHTIELNDLDIGILELHILLLHRTHKPITINYDLSLI